MKLKVDVTLTNAEAVTKARDNVLSRMNDLGDTMRILKPGDPCPCCGQPIPEGLPGETMLLLSRIAEGWAVMDAAREAADDHKEDRPKDGAAL